VKSLLILAILAVANVQAAGTPVVVSAASHQGGVLAPESIASAFGAGLGSQVTVTDSGRVTRSATVFYASPEQVNFLIPAGMRKLTCSGEA